VVGSELTLEVVLPRGLPDGRGGRARKAVLRPVNGRGELQGATAPNPMRAALELLASSLCQLGRLREEEIDLGALAGLLPLDRDFLLVQLNRLTFGDVRHQTVICPAEECGKRVDVRFDLSMVTAPEVAAEDGGSLALPDGRAIRYQLPTAGDQVALQGLAGDELESAFLARCTRAEGGGDARLLPPDQRAAVVREILAASPALDLELELRCVECGRAFRFIHDPVHSLLAELRAARPVLLREVHALALYYHWSQAEILGLSRGLRREYLGLLESELGNQRGMR
jgi:hypothetical protein